MAHELDFSRKTGRANMFSVKTVPWHNEGNIIQDVPSFQQAMALAEIDYEVRTLPLRVIVNDKLSIDSPTGRAVVRMDRLPSQKAILGMVGDGYTPLQNIEAFEILEPLIDKGLLELHTGGVLREGADAWLLGKLTIKDRLVEEVFGDRTIPYIMVSNNHNGRQPVTAMYTPIEVVCANTLAMAHHGRNKHNSTVIKKHTKSIHVSFVEAAMTFFEETMESYHLIAEDFKLLKQRILTVQEFTENVLNEVAPIPVIAREDKTSHSDSVMDRAIGKRDILTQAWDNATGNNGNRTAWEALMAVTEQLDYTDNLVRIRKSSSRLQSMINGPIQDIKQRVVNNLVQLARN